MSSSAAELYLGGEEKDPQDRTKRFFGASVYEQLVRHPVTVIGAGAVGNEVIKNLAMLGVQRLHVVDFDVVAASNLNRCIFFRPEDHQRQLKVHAIAKQVARIFPSTEIVPYGVAVQDAPADIWEVPLMVVAVDDNAARYYINMRVMSAQQQIFIVNGAMGRTFVQAEVLLPGETACLVCPWTAAYAEQLFKRLVREKCDRFFYRQITRFPAISVLTSILGGIMATEVVKILAGLHDWQAGKGWPAELTPALGQNIRYDLRQHEFSKGRIYRNPACIEVFCRQTS